MDKDIMNGTVIKLEDNSDEEFVVVDHLEKNGKEYVLLHPFELKEEEDVVELDYEKMTMIELVGEDDFEYVQDAELAKEIIDELLKK